MKKRVLSGIRATGRLHLGNYLGAVKGMLALQDDPNFETLYMVADAHSITTPYNPDELRKNRKEVVADYLACGLDPEKSIIFAQSDVSQHFELAFYFSSIVSVAKMRHLPTFKDKVDQYPNEVTMALLNYPVLMAADILLYKANVVPTGIDQEPHIEVAREVARKMNQKFGTAFPEPVRFETGGGYVPSLTGEGKMSKSVEGSFINLTDSLEVIKTKIAKVPTDSGKGFEIPKKGGIATLLKLVEFFEGKDRKAEYETKYVTEGLRYGEIKEELSGRIHESIRQIQLRREEIVNREGYIDEVLARGAEKARIIAQETVFEVKSKIGLN